MLPELFDTLLQEHGIMLTDQQKQQFETYYELLITWNQKMNLTAITDYEEVYLKHFYDSLMLAFIPEFHPQASLCDIGSGAGFPSIPLKIVFPDMEMTLIDTLSKRITFLNEVIQTLNLSKITCHHARSEDLARNALFREQFDFVTARAVARLNVLSELCLPFVKEGGYFFALKASKAQEELEEAQKAIDLCGGTYIKTYDEPLPMTQDPRYILVIQKTHKTPKKYPRKAGIPVKKPL